MVASQGPVRHSVRRTLHPGNGMRFKPLRPYTEFLIVPGLANAGYQHQITVISDGLDPAHEVMPRVHTVASLLKRWLLGTHQGGSQQQHLDYYLDEFTFRFNRRRSNARGLLFHRLVEQAVAIDPAPYRSIIGKPTNPTDSAASGQ